MMQRRAQAIFEAAVRAAQPQSAVKRAVTVERDVVSVAGKSFRRSSFDKALVLGGGKAAPAMAASLVEELRSMCDPWPIHGHIVTKYGHVEGVDMPAEVSVTEAGHPVPDSRSVQGAQRLLDLAGAADSRTLVFVVVSGGGSSLLTAPVEPLTLEDVRRTSEALLGSGATIQAMNTVRKTLSRIKGGGLARAAHPAPVVSLILSDVIGDPVDLIASGPTVPDETSASDAWSVLEELGLLRSGAIPEAVLDYLRTEMGSSQGSCSDAALFASDMVHIVGSNSIALDAAARAAEAEGLHPLILTDRLAGEAKDVGTRLAEACGSLLRQSPSAASSLEHPFCDAPSASRLEVRFPVCLIAGGETTVVLGAGEHGIGGRSQELALAAAHALEQGASRADWDAGAGGITILSAGTDGTDGPTDAAGGIVHEGTWRQLEARGGRPTERLEVHDAYHALQVGDEPTLFKTGPTGTNVMDIVLAIVHKM